MHPLAIAAAAAGAALATWKGYEVYKEKKGLAVVTELQKGKTYAVTVEFTGVGSQDLNAGSAFLNAYFTSIGFIPISQPQPKDSNEVFKYTQNQPSAWVFNATWNKDDKVVTGPGSPNVTQVLVQGPLPVS